MPLSDDERVLASLIKHMKRVEDDPITPLIDRYYMERGRSKDRLREYVIDMADRPRPHGRLSPSKICACERQAAFSFTGLAGRTKVDPEQQGVFDDGNWRHHRWQATFRDMEHVLGKDTFKVLSIEEQSQYPNLFVSGHTDAVVVFNKLKWVVDFKGINSWGFERVYRDHEPHPAHVLQLIAYMRARRIRRGILLYEHKDKNLTKGFVIRFSYQKWYEVEDWCARVIDKMERRRLPMMSLDCQAGTLLFEKCPWAHICYGKHDDEEIRRRMYKNFPGCHEAWVEGNEIERAFKEGVPL